MASVALLSNPRSTGNRSLLPRIRSFCANHPDVFHYEVETVDQVTHGLAVIMRTRPKVLVINGGDGTVQAALTRLYSPEFADTPPPPVAVLPNGKTNMIALDLGASGDPIAALGRIIDLARGDLSEHIVVRELISLTGGDRNTTPVLGMFLGGAGLAETMLFCRNKIYPLGLPNGFSHVLTAIAMLLSLLFGLTAAFLPPRPRPVHVTVRRGGEITGRFSLLIVTTLQKMLLATQVKLGNESRGGLQLLMVDQSALAIIRGVTAGLFGGLGRKALTGVHVDRGDEITIAGDRSSVILDGEVFQARNGFPIVLTHTPPVPFLRLAA